METTMLALLYLLLFSIGVIFVVWGSNGAVMGATLINKMTKVPMFFLGMFVVAIATTSSEFMVNIFATIEGNVQIAVSNIVGSNIFNIAGILGICAIMSGIVSDRDVVTKQVPLAAASILALSALSLDGELSRTDGFVLLCFFAIYLVYLYLSAKKATRIAHQTGQHEHHDDEIEEPRFLVIFWDILFQFIGWLSLLILGREKHTERKIHRITGDTIHPVAKIIIYMVFGFGILIVGSKLIVENSVELARIAGLSEAFIGLTIVVIGTSMPEFVISVMSIIKRKGNLAIGNIVGANTLNTLWALGFDTAFLRPLPFDRHSKVDMYVSFGVAVFLWLFMYIGKRYELERWQGVIFVVGFIAYVVFKYVSLPRP